MPRCMDCHAWYALLIRRGRRVRPISIALVFGASAVVAAVVVPAVRAHVRAAAPVNTRPPALVIEPGLGSRVEIRSGTWTGATSFSYQYLRCPEGGGAPDGSQCTPTTSAPLSAPGVHLIVKADVGHSFRARVTAINTAGQQTTAVSAASATATESEVRFCPLAQQAGATVEELRPPARLRFDRHTNSPAVITRSTQRITLRVEVVACEDQYVRGAIVYATPTPFQMFSDAEAVTNNNGWATLTLTRKRFFPASPRQQLFVIFLRASKPGEDLLGGISTRQLISLPVRLQ
jgi:hypothetical protein